MALPSSLASFPHVVPDTLHSALIAHRQNGFREVNEVTGLASIVIIEVTQFAFVCSILRSGVGEKLSR